MHRQMRDWSASRSPSRPDPRTRGGPSVTRRPGPGPAPPSSPSCVTGAWWPARGRTSSSTPPTSSWWPACLGPAGRGLGTLLHPAAGVAALLALVGVATRGTTGWPLAAPASRSPGACAPAPCWSPGGVQHRHRRAGRGGRYRHTPLARSRPPTCSSRPSPDRSSPAPRNPSPGSYADGAPRSGPDERTGGDGAQSPGAVHGGRATCTPAGPRTRPRGGTPHRALPRPRSDSVPKSMRVISSTRRNRPSGASSPNR